jgi:hypothetical protein
VLNKGISAKTPGQRDQEEPANFARHEGISALNKQPRDVMTAKEVLRHAW